MSVARKDGWPSADIVKRLRDCHLVFKHRDIAEAAGEIERLRAALQTIADAELTYDYDSGATLSNLARDALSQNTNGET